MRGAYDLSAYTETLKQEMLASSGQLPTCEKLKELSKQAFSEAAATLLKSDPTSLLVRIDREVPLVRCMTCHTDPYRAGRPAEAGLGYAAGSRPDPKERSSNGRLLTG